MLAVLTANLAEIVQERPAPRPPGREAVGQYGDTSDRDFG